MMIQMSMPIIISIFSCLLHFVASETVCEAIERRPDQNAIQGVVLYPDRRTGLLFVRERVFRFNPSLDFDASRDHHPTLRIRSAAISIEKYFPNLYLRDGSTIFNVYGTFTNESGNIFFVLANDKLADQSFRGTGFMYDLERQRCIAVDGSIVTPQFPWIYFSDNRGEIFLYQMPTYAFHATSSGALNMRGQKSLSQTSRKEEEEEDDDETAFFAFNLYDREMRYERVTGIAGLRASFDRWMRVMRVKAKLRAGFVYENRVYLLTERHVYVLPERIRGAASVRNRFAHRKIALSEFLRCDPKATFDPIDWPLIIAYALAAILLLIIFALANVIVRKQKIDPEDYDDLEHRSKYLARHQ